LIEDHGYLNNLSLIVAGSRYLAGRQLQDVTNEIMILRMHPVRVVNTAAVVI